jgi:hypothetical protein
MVLVVLMVVLLVLMVVVVLMVLMVVLLVLMVVLLVLMLVLLVLVLVLVVLLLLVLLLLVLLLLLLLGSLDGTWVPSGKKNETQTGSPGQGVRSRGRDSGAHRGECGAGVAASPRLHSRCRSGSI